MKEQKHILYSLRKVDFAWASEPTASQVKKRPAVYSRTNARLADSNRRRVKSQLEVIAPPLHTWISLAYYNLQIQQRCHFCRIESPLIGVCFIGILSLLHRHKVLSLGLQVEKLPD